MKTAAQNKKQYFSWKNFFKFFFIIPVFTSLFLLQSTPSYAGISKQINFQGKLVDNNGLTIADGTQYQLIFSLYNVSSGGSAVWTETQSNVTVSGGIFQVTLGSVTSLAGVDFNNPNLYLGITVSKNGSGGATGESEMTPRIQFNAVAYAFNADKLDGVVATQAATGFSLSGGTLNSKTLTVNNSLSFSGTDGVTYTLGAPVSGTTSTLLTSNTSSQTINTGSTQTSGTVLSLSTSSPALTAGLTGLSITLNGTGAQAETGLTFNVSAASGTLTDIQGTSSNWKVLSNGQATFASGTSITNNGASYLQVGDTASSGTYYRIYAGLTTTGDGGITDGNANSKIYLAGAQQISSLIPIDAVGIGPGFMTPHGALDVEGGSKAGSAVLILNQLGTSATSDLLTASSSGVAKFTVQKDGTIVSGKYNTSNGLVFTDNTGTLQQVATGSNGNCLTAGVNGAISWGSCSAGGGGARLDQVSAATTNATIANGDNPIIWNWAPTTAGRTDFTFGATAAPASGTNTALAISLTHTSNTITNGLYVNSNGTGGTTTNGIQIQQSAGTLTNGLVFTGTIANDITTGTSGRALTINTNGAGAITIDSGGAAGVNIGNTNANAIVIGNTTNTATVGINTSASTGNGVTITANSLSTGNGLLVTSSGSITGTGNLVAIVGNSATTGDLLSISGTGLTTGNGIQITGGTAVTTGGDLYLNGAVYQHAAAQTGSLATIAFTDNTNVAGNSTTNGLLINSTFNLQGASGAKQVSGISVSSPTINGCSGGTTCTWDGLQINTATTTNTAITENGLHIIPNATAPSGVWNGILVDTTTTGAPSGATYTGLNISGITTTGAGAESAIKIGSGWNNAISAAGNIRIESQTNSSLAQQQTFTKITQATAGTISNNGGDTSGIASISAMAVFEGSLYVGTYNNPGGAEVYRYNGTAGSWTKVSQATAGTIASGGTSGIASVSAMTVFNGNLYIGTSKVAAAEVYRYDGGTNWTKVSNGTGNLRSGGTNSIDGVSALAVYGGNLYAGTRIAAKAELYEYNGSNNWTVINTTAGTFVATNSVAVDAITSLVVKNGWLYLGELRNGDADVLRYNGGQGATSSQFESLNNVGTTGSYLIDGIATTGFNEVTAMVVYNGSLVVALRRGTGLADILSVNDGDATAVGNDMNNWNRLINGAGTMTSGGTSGINSIGALMVYNGRLYATTQKNSNQAEIYRYETPGIWTKLNPTGTLAGGTGTTIDSITRMQAYNGNLYLGTFKQSGGAEVYQYTAILDQSYALTFHASSSIAGGEQNSLTNQGSIYFVASVSAQASNVGAQTGAFVFDHSIVTNNGAYDVAEDYPTRDDSLKPGDLVAIDAHEKGLVTKSGNPYDKNVIGVYSQKPALELSQTDGQIDGIPSVAVALVGRVPINVSTESGQINEGDYLVSSSIPGVAMKATKPGPVIAQALENFDASTSGQILGFVEHSYYNGIDSSTNSLPQDPLSAIAILQTQLNQDQSTFSDFMASTSAVLSAMTATPSSNLSLSSLSVDGLATISADLRVKGSGLIEGMLSIVDTLTSKNLIITSFSDFLGNVIFHGNVQFNNRPIVSSDTAGEAVIKKGSQQVDISFANTYVSIPVITATLDLNASATSQNDVQQQILQNNYQYIIGNKSATGFSIILNKPAQQDLSFSWIALGVNNLQHDLSNSFLPSVTPTSDSAQLLISPTAMPIMFDTPTPTP